MLCRDVEEVLGQEGLAPLPESVRAHVAGCKHCQGYIGDLETILSVAVQLPAEVDPPARVWINLRNQLEQEGIIRGAVATAGGAPWWSRLGELFRGRALVTATAGLVLAVGAIVQVSQPPDAIRKWTIATCTWQPLHPWTRLSNRISGKWMISLPTASVT